MVVVVVMALNEKEEEELRAVSLLHSLSLIQEEAVLDALCTKALDIVRRLADENHAYKAVETALWAVIEEKGRVSGESSRLARTFGI